MKAFLAWWFISVSILAFSQNAPESDEPAQPPPLSLKALGIAYPLSNDWVRATQMVSKRVESHNSSQNFDVVLAAVYVPKSSMSASNPFFSLLAYRQQAGDCKRSLEAMIAHSQGKEKPEGGVVEFSAAGREYFRVNLSLGADKRHRCTICANANGHLLIWNAGAPNEKGLDAIVETLNSITSLPRNMRQNPRLPPSIKTVRRKPRPQRQPTPVRT